MLEHAASVLDMFDVVHPGEVAVLVFDNSSGHEKFPPDALRAANLGLKVGGKGQDIVRAGWYVRADGDRIVQHMVLQPDDDVPQFQGGAGGGGVPKEFAHLGDKWYVGKGKGVRQILWERGLWRDDLRLESARDLLDAQPDFREAKSALQEMIEDRGHRCIFLPKFHCELNPIEMVWGRMKKELRRICEYSFPALVRNAPTCLQAPTINGGIVIKFCRRSREFFNVYRNNLGISCPQTDVMRKIEYESHRRPAPSTFQ